jgi:hypothetical protein
MSQGSNCREAQKFSYEFWENYWLREVPAVYEEVNRMNGGVVPGNVVAAAAVANEAQTSPIGRNTEFVIIAAVVEPLPAKLLRGLLLVAWHVRCLVLWRHRLVSQVSWYRWVKRKSTATDLIGLRLHRMIFGAQMQKWRWNGKHILIGCVKTTTILLVQ